MISEFTGDARRDPHPMIHRFSARTLGEYSWSVCSVYILASLCYLALPWTGYVFSALVFLLAIVLAALRWQRGPVLVMATLSALLWNFLFIPPKFTLHIEKPEDAIMFGMFFLVALSMGHLTSRLHEREQSLERQKSEKQALLEVLQKSVLSLEASGEFNAAVDAMKNIIGADLAVFLRTDSGETALTPHPSSRFCPTPEEWTAVHWCAEHGSPAGRHMDKFPELETSWLPIESQKGRIGVVGFCWQEEVCPDFSTHRMMEALTLQLALVIERQSILDTERKAEIALQSERLHRILFDSVSHELKTPIAVIRAALDGLNTRDPFVTEIETATQRLQRIVEHFLEISRLESAHLTPLPDWIDISDLLENSKRILGTEWPPSVRVESEIFALPLIRVDGRLLAQALANIVHNAAVHAGRKAPVTIRIELQDHVLSISVRDQGPGIAQGSEVRVFDKFYRAPGAPAGGTGLGLAIARGFVRAQGGDILAQNHPEGGAEFQIRLPVETHHLAEEKTDEHGANHR